jgi:hypothetical protein
MARKNPLFFIDTTKNFASDLRTKERYRLSKKDFTRNRKLPFENLVLCMLKNFRRTLQVELNSFFKQFKLSAKGITASGFVQNRKKVNPDLFYDLNHLIVLEFYSDNDENNELYKGHRLLSIDGSNIQLPVSDDLKKTFGVYNNQTVTDDVIIGRVSVLYDVLNNIVLDGKLCTRKTGEVTLSREHLCYAKKGDLIIMDRAYPCFETAFRMQQQGIEFLFRCKQDYSNEVKAFFISGKREAMVGIKPSQHKSFKDFPYTADSRLDVRLLRVVLSSGEVEILMTSLHDQKKYPYSEFKRLYSLRWGIETFYNRFKNIISVEHFSGTSTQFVQQEFNCALYMSNMQTIFTQNAQAEVDEKYSHRKYEYKINSSLSLGFIRERLTSMFADNTDSEKIMKELEELFVCNVVPIRPGRSNPRIADKYRRRKRPKQFRNRRPIL